MFFFNEYQGFWWIKLIGTILSLLSVPFLFYTVNGAFGKTPDFINILIFFISAGIGYLIEFVLLKINFILPLNFIPITIFVGLAILFVCYTFNPPKIPLFLDPLTKTYGYRLK